MTAKNQNEKSPKNRLEDALEEDNWSNDPIEDSLEEMYESDEQGNALCYQISQIKSPELRSMFARLISARCSDQALSNFLIESCSLKLKILDDDGNVVSEDRAIDKMLKFLGTKAVNASSLRQQLAKGFRMPSGTKVRAAYAGEPNF